MLDPVGSILSWTVIAGSTAYVFYHLAQIIKTHRLEAHSAAAIMFGTALLILQLPGKVYDLPPDALNTLSWVAIAMVFVSVGLELSSGRFKRRSGTPGSS